MTDREAIARALFQRWKDRSASSIIKPAPGSYVLDPWEGLPPSVQMSFEDDADAVIAALEARNLRNLEAK